MQEYYVRKEGDEEASGPFNIDQISSLVDLGKLDKEAYIYDVDQENWVQIKECEDLMKTLYPEKKKLSLKAEKTQEELAEEAEAAAGQDRKSRKEAKEAARLAEEEKKRTSVSVTKMLAQAEGREGDDATGESPIEKRSRAAYLGLRFSTLFVWGAAAAMIFLEWDLAKTANALEMVKSPYLVFAAVDILLGLVLLLQVTEIYPLARFRAAIGLGTLSILFLASGDPLLALSNAVLCCSLYFCTATLSKAKVIPFCITGVLGLGGFVYLIILPHFS